MAALGIKSLHIVPQADGDVDSTDPDGTGGVLVAPSVPVLGTPVATSSTTVDVLLSAASTGPSTPITYVLEISSTGPSTGFTVAASGDIFAGDSTASLTSLTQSTTYYFRCQAVGADTAVSAYSAVVSIATPATVADTTAPGATGTPVVSAITSTTATVTYTAATDNVAVTGYDILRGLGDGAGNAVGSGAIIATAAGLSFNDSGLTSSQQYYYRVRAKDAAGNVGAYTSRVFFTTSAGSVVYDLFDNFEAASVDSTKFSIELQGGANTLVDISTAVTALSGTRSLRAKLAADSTADFRAEVAWTAIQSPPGKTHFNEDCWYGLAIYLPAGYVQSSSQDILFQLHTYSWLESPAESGTSPTVDITTNNGKWRAHRRANTANPSTSSTQGNIGFDLGSYATGVWTRFVLRVKHHWINGELEIWKDDALVWGQASSTSAYGGNCANDTYAPYPKCGIYRAGNKTAATLIARTVYFDNCRAIINTTGDHYNDVRP